MNVRQQLARVTAVDAPVAPYERALYHGARIAVLLLLAVVTYALFPASPAVDTPIFETGAVATQSVIAPFAFDVRKPDVDLQREREELARSAKPIYTYVPAALDSSQSELEAFMRAVGDSAAAGQHRPDPGAIQRAAEAVGVSLSSAEAEYLASTARRRALQEGIRRLFARWLGAGVAASGATDDVHGEAIVRHGAEERSAIADSIPTFGTLLVKARAAHPDPSSSVGDALYLKLLSKFFHPTIDLDRVATEQRRQELRASVSVNRYQVRAGEKIVGEHEVVGKAEFDKLRALHDAMQARSGSQLSVGRVIGAMIYNALVLGIFGIAIALFRPQLYRSVRSLTLIALLFLLVIVGAALVSHLEPLRPEMVLVALAAIMCSALFDPRISMIAATMLAVLVGGQSVFRGTNALFLNLIGGAAAALSVRVIRRRDQFLRSFLIVAGAYLCGAVAVGLTLGWTVGEIAGVAFWGSVNAFVSFMLATFLLPLAERFTGITTDLTLLEYSDLNRPLLRRLSLEAPGTYDHTMKMAVLAEEASNAIGANGLLARVGTYYHDIGKLAKPQYFVENQPRGRNPHDKLKPGTSAAIIRNHVREGIELAEENHLPPAITAFIPEHHGTAQITYFWEKAKERDGAEPTNTSEYIYPGPIPQSAETAVAMLADGVEASVRVLNEPTPEKIREVIEHMVRQRVESGQLRDAPLTLRQLDVIKEQFARVLVGQYHNRLDYPAASGGITSEFASV